MRTSKTNFAKENLTLSVLNKIVILLCFLIVSVSGANAQISQKLPRKPKGAASVTRIKPAITSPTAGSIIKGPFVLVGKAEPNSFVNVIVSPIYKIPASTDGKPVLVVSGPQYKRQELVVKANANGIWQSPVIEVQFDSKATGRRIFASVWQKWDTQIYESKNTEYIVLHKVLK